jgi:hypothetical protein
VLLVKHDRCKLRIGRDPGQRYISRYLPVSWTEALIIDIFPVPGGPCNNNPNLKIRVSSYFCCIESLLLLLISSLVSSTINSILCPSVPSPWFPRLSQMLCKGFLTTLYLQGIGQCRTAFLIVIVVVIIDLLAVVLSNLLLLDLCTLKFQYSLVIKI